MTTPISQKNHTVLYKNGSAEFVVIPYAEYQDWVDENTLIPNDVVQLMVKHDCNLIGAWRRYRQFTQAQFCEKMQCSQAAVSQIEQSENPQQATLYSAADILGCTIEQLMD